MADFCSFPIASHFYHNSEYSSPEEKKEEKKQDGSPLRNCPACIYILSLIPTISSSDPSLLTPTFFLKPL